MFNNCIYFNLSTLSRKINKVWQEEFNLLGLSPSHAYLLAAMAANPAASQKELSEIMELDASTITRFIDKLAAKKLIKKNSTGKGASFSLTEKGITANEQINLMMNELFKNMQTVFGKNQFSQIVGNLQKARKNLEEY